MSYLPSEGYKRIPILSLYIVLAAAGSYLFIKYLLSPLLPFIFAWIMVMALRPLINKISHHTSMPKKAICFICILLAFLMFFGIVGVICSRLLSELKGITENLMADAAEAVGDVFDYFDKYSKKLPFVDGIENKQTAEKVRGALTDMIENAATSISSKIPSAIMGIISSLPGILLFTIVLIVAAFYMGNEIDSINRFITGLIPKGSRHYLFEAKKKLASAGIKYVKAYIMILLITFVQLLIGFVCLKIPYALTLSSLIAIIDILPVLGVGTVLLPWATVVLIRGDTYTGIGLLLVFAVIWVVRQVIEPKIVGSSIGLSPLATLATMYIGYKLTGFGGLFLFPLLAILITNLYDIGITRLPLKK